MRRSTQGSGLIIVLFSIAIFSTLVGVTFLVTTNNARLAKRTADHAAAVAHADGVIEDLFDQWRQAMISVSDETDRKQGMSNQGLRARLGAPPANRLPPKRGVTLQEWRVESATPLLTERRGNSDRPVPENGTSSSLRVRLNYLATAKVKSADSRRDVEVTVQRAFVRGGRNLFEHFFFGTQPHVEFHPGPAMFIDGSIYVGGNLYTAHDSLKFLKDVTFTGEHVLGYRPEDARSRSSNETQITVGGLDNNWDPNNPPRRGQEQKLLDTTRAELDPAFLDDDISNDQDSNGNLNDDGYREIIEEVSGTAADPLKLDASTSERLPSNADYRIEVDAANIVSVYKGASTTALPSNGNGSAEGNAIKAALVLNTALKDVRDADNVRVVGLDVGKLTKSYDVDRTISDQTGGDGLLIYIKDTSAGAAVTTKIVNSATGTSSDVTSSRARGVRLLNGGKLPSAGLTIATPHALYIQGDYNSGHEGPDRQPQSNTATNYTPPNDRPSPTYGTYQTVASAVVGDAVNILSNGWNDANSVEGLGSRIAASTTVNTAIVAGNVPSKAAGSYSGGIENFVRFHENWGGKYFTVLGSFALLYNSREAVKPWSAASYGAPMRRWFYDPALGEKNPPGFNVARYYERGRWMLR